MNRSIVQLVLLFSGLFGVCTLILFLVLRHANNNNLGINLGPFQLRPSYLQTAQRQPVKPPISTVDGLFDPDQIKELLNAALEDIDHDRINDAEDKVRTAMVFDPDNIQALTIAGRIFYNNKRYLEAEGIFRRQARLSPGNPTVLNNLGSTLAKLNKFNEAVNYLDQAWEKNPDSPEIIINLAGAYAMAGDRSMALMMLHRGERILGPALIPLAEDSCFDSIRQSAEFRRILRRAADGSPATTVRNKKL